MATEPITQVDDDIELLESMMSAQAEADPIFHTTNYWQRKCVQLAGYLREFGLKDFRRLDGAKKTPQRVLASFGAIDRDAGLPLAEALAAVQRRAGETQAVSISRLPASRVGNPEGGEVEGVFYTQSWLNFYLRYAYVSRFMNLGGKTIVEIGGGSGKQAHMLKLAHPDATIILFDIPPQLYVANQYLLKCFEGQNVVVGYRDASRIRSSDAFEKGKIYVLGNWQIPLLKDFSFDLLWNAASFQEMEPPVVRHYLDFCRGARNVYLMEVMDGQSVAPTAGQNGVLEATTLETYKDCLRQYALSDLCHAPLAIPVMPLNWRYSESFWQQKRQSAKAIPLQAPDTAILSKEVTREDAARVKAAVQMIPVDLEGAIALSRQIVAAGKKANILFRCAHAYLRDRKFAQALAAIEESLSCDPVFAPAHMVRANALLALEDFEGAKIAAGQALTVDANNVAAQAFLDRETDREDAVRLKRALQILPGDVEGALKIAHETRGIKKKETILLRCATVLAKNWRLPEALKIVDEIVSFDSAFASAHALRADVLANMGDREGARAAAREALVHDPLNPPAYEFLNNERDRSPQLLAPSAILELAKEKGSSSDIIKALNVLTRADPVAAIELAKSSVVIVEPPLVPEVNFIMGVCYGLVGDNENAIETLKLCLTGAKQRRPAAMAIARLLHDDGRYQEAEEWYREAVAAGLNENDFHIVRYQMDLTAGDLRTAFKGYRKNGRGRDSLREMFPDKYLAQDASLKELPSSTRLFVIAVSGIGDEIRMASLYPELCKRFPDITITCSPRLHSILQRSFPKAKFIPVLRWRKEMRAGDYVNRTLVRSDAAATALTDEAVRAAADADVVVATTEILADMRPDRASFNRKRAAYFVADPRKSRKLKIKADRPQIGLAWSSMLGGVFRDIHYLSAEDMAPFAEIDADFWLLQPVISEEERTFLEMVLPNANVPPFDTRDDFESMAAFLPNLDAVVSPIATTGDIAGAMGVRTYLLSNSRLTTWRRNEDGSDIWHPNARLVCAEPVGDRERLIEATVEAIRRDLADA
jgi:putative sugar O-methyltransferase